MRVLCIDGGSSTLKLALYDMPSETCVASETAAIDEADALNRFLKRLGTELDSCAAVSHRIVFGGPDHMQPECLTPKLLDELEQLSSYDPLHMRTELAAVRAITQLLPNLPQVLCFDTAFHRRMPEVAKRYALSDDFSSMVQRYGYHGLSYEYVTSALGPGGRRIVAHLGSGASLAAIHDSEPIDTTMGFSPLGGLMMATRPGDLDPGVILFALSELKFSPEKLRQVLNESSGFFGLAGTRSMEELLGRSTTDARAAIAVELFVYTTRKYIGAMAAALNGLDELVFTGGIGENSSEIRRRVAEGLTYLGIAVDPDKNAQHASIISPAGDAVHVRVIKTNEALMMARHATELLRVDASI